VADPVHAGIHPDEAPFVESFLERTHGDACRDGLNMTDDAMLSIRN
jgi:hypothetical protein